MKRHILVPLDGSPLAEVALPHAISIAGATSQGITLLRAVPLHSIDNLVAWPVPTSGAQLGKLESWQHEVDAAKDYLAGLAGQLEAAGITTQSEVSEGDPAMAIVSNAEQHPEVSLVAMATHGRSGVNRWVFGSVAEKVLHASPVPLLLVKGRPDHRLKAMTTPEYRTILVPLDGSLFAEQALQEARALAAATEAELILICAVSEFPEFTVIQGPNVGMEQWQGEAAQIAAYLEQTAASIRAQGVKVRTRIEYGAPADAILYASEMVHAALIVMATHGRSGLQRAWLGSVALKVVQGASWPVLLVRAKERIKEQVVSRSARGDVVRGTQSLSGAGALALA